MMIDSTFFSYCIAKIKYKITHNREVVSNFYRKEGIKVGKNCVICSFLKIAEPFLVEIGDDCVVSSDVLFITHDHSINKVTDRSNLFGRIIIGNNCFIGQGSILLYGVELSSNIIVASESVVTRSFDEGNIIIGGNPAKKIGTWDNFKRKHADKAVNRDELEGIVNGSIDKLVHR